MRRNALDNFFVLLQYKLSPDFEILLINAYPIVMNPLSAKLFKVIYRKEPMSGFILLFGITDAFLGGFQGRWSLFSMGLVVIMTGIWMRWLQAQKTVSTPRKKSARYRLPPSTAAIPLPTLTSKKRYR